MASSSAFEEFFSLLSGLHHEQASRAAQKLPCARSLQLALQQLVTCEALYLSMFSFATRRSSLERRLDRTARDLEACLSHGVALPPRTATPWAPRFDGAQRIGTPWAPRFDSGVQQVQVRQSTSCLDMVGMVVESVVMSILTCQPLPWPPPWLALKGVDQSGAGTVALPSTSRSPSTALAAPGRTAEAAEVARPPLDEESTLSAAQRGALSDTDSATCIK